MVEDTANKTDATTPPDGEAVKKAKREKSLIEFPYADLKHSVELAKILHQQGGQTKIEYTQLAVAMDQTATGGTFRSRLSAARMFGLINTSQEMVWLEPLGLRVLDNTHSASANVEAFLNVPLYQKIFESYNGYSLPPAAAIERQMEVLGVPAKQKARARQAFSVSAVFAGFIAANGRFSKPTVVSPPPLPDENLGEESPLDGKNGNGGGGGEPPSKNLPKLIAALVESLPRDGETWSLEDASEWLQAAAYNFRYAYKLGKVLKVDITAA